MSEHYRNCHSIFSKRIDKADQAVWNQVQPKPGGDPSAREDFSEAT